jgi:hypothetical protein
MKNSKLVEEAKLNPRRIYSRPQDVLRDRRLRDAERLEILAAWERELSRSAAEAPLPGGSPSEELAHVKREIELRLPAAAGSR